jgi:hypothetical protein
MPLSLRWLARNWHAGIHLHGIIALLYWIDIVRRHSHPHSWVFNIPGAVFLIGDYVAQWYWRRQTPNYQRVTISEDYILLCWRQQLISNTVGAKFFARLTHSSWTERPHVFTGFENRVGCGLSHGKRDWSSALLIRVYRAARLPPLGAIDCVSHTSRMADGEDNSPPPLHTWGPYLGNMSEFIRARLARQGRVILVGGGSAAGYLIDALQFAALPGAAASVTVLYSTRDPALLQWVVSMFAEVTARVVEAGWTASAVAALTSPGKDGLKACTALLPEAERPGVRVQAGRLDVVEELPEHALVFVQGSSGLQKAVASACKVRHCGLHRGATYD